MAAELPPYIVEEIGRLAEEQSATVLEIVRRGHTNSTVLEIIVDSVSGTLSRRCCIDKSWGQCAARR